MINKINICLNNLNSVLDGQRGLGKKSVSELDDMTMFAFEQSILLECVWTGELGNNAMVDEKLTKLKASAFTAVVTPKCLNFEVKLIFN